jgi:arsenate reductase (thioredoxin)
MEIDLRRTGRADVGSGRRWLVMTIVVVAALAPAAPGVGASTQDNVVPATTATVLFMCPHGAAKSVLASAYFERLAKERGLNVRVESAGTDPDSKVSPAVAAHLKRQGYPAPKSTPRKVMSKDFQSADVVISIGCDVSGLPEPRGKLVRWDEVPPLSDNFAMADEAIRKRVTELVEELVLTAQRKEK